MSLRYPEGSECGMWFAVRTPIIVEEGHYIVTCTRKGWGTGYRVHRIVSIRWIEGAEWPLKYSLRVLRCKPENIPPGAVIHSMVWDKR